MFTVAFAERVLETNSAQVAGESNFFDEPTEEAKCKLKNKGARGPKDLVVGNGGRGVVIGQGA